MKKLLLILSIIIMIAINSCVTEVKYPSVDSVSISPETVNITPGSTHNFTAKVEGKNNPPQTVIWSITGTNNENTTIDQGGFLRVAQNETLTFITVTATSTYDKSKNKNATVGTFTITNITINPSNVNVAPGNTQQFTATVNGTNNPPPDVIWTLTGNNHSSTNINSSGMLTVNAEETSTSISVKATSTYNTDVSASVNVTITGTTITSINITPSSANISPGNTQQFTATVNGTNNPPQTVTWSIAENNSSSSNINSNGLLSVANNETSTTIRVRAKSTHNTAVIGSVYATILVPSVTSINISPPSVNVSPGNTQQFNATVNGNNNPPQTVTWSISGNNHSYTNINSGGLLTVNANENSPSIEVKATSTYNTNVCGTANVSVTIISVGDIIPFGGHNWRVLVIDNNRALIISQNVLERRAYHTSYTNITWEYCTLRTYLNGTFYNSFSAADRARIHQVTNQNPNNPTCGTPGGNPTQDRIFLLSIAEAQQYFSSNADRIATYNGSAVWWWLRSPGDDSIAAAYVYGSGDIYMYGSYVGGTDGGVRPALWLNL